MAIHELSALLWREREMLELLTFKLEEEQLLLTAGKSKWLHHATLEVEQTIDRLRAAGLARTVEVSAVARGWGLSEDATLRELAEAAPEGPWGEILTSHLKAMTAQTERIRELRDANEQFLRAASRSTQETLAGHRAEAGLYDAHGMTSDAAGSRLFDTKL
jgi:flagellar biosynthesis/type III secretory pathway chaperone